MLKSKTLLPSSNMICETCGSSQKGKYANDVMSHIFKHMKLKEFLCETCGYQTAFRACLNTHNRDVHDNKGRMVKQWTQHFFDQAFKVGIACFPTAYDALQMWHTKKIARYVTNRPADATFELPVLLEGPAQETKNDKDAKLLNGLTKHEPPDDKNDTPQTVNLFSANSSLIEPSAYLESLCSDEIPKVVNQDEVPLPASTNDLSHLHDIAVQCTKCKTFISTINIRPYKRMIRLIKHSKQHLEDRPYVCSQCGCGFKTDQTCKKHLKIHREGGTVKETWDAKYLKKLFTVTQSNFPQYRAQFQTYYEKSKPRFRRELESRGLSCETLSFTTEQDDDDEDSKFMTSVMSIADASKKSLEQSDPELDNDEMFSSKDDDDSSSRLSEADSNDQTAENGDLLHSLNLFLPHCQKSSGSINDGDTMDDNDSEVLFMSQDVETLQNELRVKNEALSQSRIESEYLREELNTMQVNFKRVQEILKLALEDNERLKKLIGQNQLEMQKMRTQMYGEAGSEVYRFIHGLGVNGSQ